MGDLLDIGFGALTEGGDSIDGGDALGEEGVGDELGELRGPEVGGDDALTGDPVGVEVDDGLDGLLPGGGVVPADEDAIGGFEIADGGAFSEEFGVGEDFEADAVAVGVEDVLHGVGGADGEGGFFDDDLGGGGGAQDLAGGLLPILEVGGTTGALPEGFGGGVDGDEDDVCLVDVVVDVVGGEEEVAPAGNVDDFFETGFVDGEGV